MAGAATTEGGIEKDWSIPALLISVFCASAAALAQGTVLGKQVYDITGSEFDLGLLGLAEFAPAALLVLVTGAVADRYQRRRVASVAALGEAVAAGALAWYAGTNPTSVTPMFVIVLAFGVARAFAAPASRSLPADIVPSARLPWLVARYSATWQAAIVVGPVLGGFLYAVNIRLPYLAIMVLLVIASVSLFAVHVQPTERAAIVAPPLVEAAVEPVVGHGEAAPAARAGWHEAIEGLRFIRRRPVLLGAISLDLFAVLFGGAIALLPAIAKDRLGVGAVGLGWLRAAGGLGAAAVTVGLAVRPLNRRVGRVLLVVVAAFGVGTIVLGVTRSFVVAFVAMAALSGADAVSVFIRATLVPLATPEDKRGRVLAVENVFIGASNELGAFESGVAGQLIGTTGAVVLGGVGTLAVAIGWWFLFPGLRKVDRFPDP
jgi:MFS family permease